MSPKTLSTIVASVAFTSVLLGTVHILRADSPTFASGEVLSAAKMNDSFAQVSNRLDALERSNAARDAVPLVPAGTIVAYGGASAPEGWLLCDGSALDRVAEPTLFTAIGTGWGAPDPTKFNVPDLRGRFLRGVDAKSGHDPESASRSASAPGGNTGDAVGTFQPDALIAHTHDYASFSATGIGYDTNNHPATTIAGFNPATTSVTGGAETRPRNASVVYIIKR